MTPILVPIEGANRANGEWRACWGPVEMDRNSCSNVHQTQAFTDGSQQNTRGGHAFRSSPLEAQLGEEPAALSGLELLLKDLAGLLQQLQHNSPSTQWKVLRLLCPIRHGLYSMKVFRIPGNNESNDLPLSNSLLPSMPSKPNFSCLGCLLICP